MSQPAPDPLEAILYLCAQAAPQPWYPKAYAEATGVLRDSLDPLLELLRLRGLVRLTEWVEGRGQGYELTTEGKRVLYSPKLLTQLRNGTLPPPAPEPDEAPRRPDRGATPFERGEAIRDALLSRAPPRVTQILIAANVVVFLAGLALAVHLGFPLQDFILSSRTQILYATGAVDIFRLAEGEWWRLLTSCFVHVGLVHLGVNMYALYIVGPPLERFLGRWRYLLLYLVAGWGGSCIGVIAQLGGAGASGAICGLLGATAAWAYLNRQYLPPALFASVQRYLVINTLLIGGISILGYQYISWSGHLGGAVFGLVAGALLNGHRFGSVRVRSLALVATLLLPVLALAALTVTERIDPRWQQAWNYVGAKDLEERILPKARALEREAEKLYEDARKPLNQHWKRRDGEEVQKAIPALEEGRTKLQEAVELLAKAGPYVSHDMENARNVRKEHLEEQVKLFELREKCLREGEAWTPAEQETLRDQTGLVEEAAQRWRALLKDGV